MSKNKQKKKEVRKPISDNYAPKRLAINFQPPTMIMEYLAVDTGKLYHHKMRLDSIFKRVNVNRIDVLNYIKNKHHLYFTNGKVKDAQLLKFIDKIIARSNKNKNKQETKVPLTAYQASYNEANDFDYLNDDDSYDEDYQDYQEPQDKPHPEVKKQTTNFTKSNAFNKNTFLTFCKEYEESNDQEGSGAQWDLNMQDNADFV